MLNTGSSTWMPGHPQFLKSLRTGMGKRQCSLDAEGPCVLWTLLRTLEPLVKTRSFRFLPQSPAALLPLQFCFWSLIWNQNCSRWLLPFGPQLANRIIFAAFPHCYKKSRFLVFCSSTTLLYIGPWTLQFQWYSQLFNLFSFSFQLKLRGTFLGLEAYLTPQFSPKKSSLATESIP